MYSDNEAAFIRAQGVIPHVRIAQPAAAPFSALARPRLINLTSLTNCAVLTKRATRFVEICDLHQLTAKSAGAAGAFGHRIIMCWNDRSRGRMKLPEAPPPTSAGTMPNPIATLPLPEPVVAEPPLIVSPLVCNE